MLSVNIIFVPSKFHHPTTTLFCSYQTQDSMCYSILYININTLNQLSMAHHSTMINQNTETIVHYKFTTNKRVDIFSFPFV